MLLTEFDANQKAVINPADCQAVIPGMPKVAVSCFSRITFARMAERLNAQPMASSISANMEYPVYRAAYAGVELALFMAGVGAPVCVANAEDYFRMGGETIVLFGTCGVLDKGIGDCSIIIPTSALRDEGTSFHYAPATDEIEVNPRYREDFIGLLRELGISYTKGKTWTTDAIYRETREKVERRCAAGCVCVDMECSAMAALAQFRGKEVFQFFYAADNLDAEEWEPRSLMSDDKVDEKDRVAELALQFARQIALKKKKEKEISFR